MKTIEELDSAVPVNNAGDGKIDGIGVGPKGEPPGKPKKKRLRDVLSRRELER